MALRGFLWNQCDILTFYLGVIVFVRLGVASNVSFALLELLDLDLSIKSLLERCEPVLMRFTSAGEQLKIDRVR